MTAPLKVEVNGKSREYPQEAFPKSLKELIESLGLDCRLVAAELNGEVVKRSDFPFRTLADGDIVELVRFVGGG